MPRFPVPGGAGEERCRPAGVRPPVRVDAGPRPRRAQLVIRRRAAPVRMPSTTNTAPSATTPERLDARRPFGQVRQAGGPGGEVDQCGHPRGDPGGLVDESEGVGKAGAPAVRRLVVLAVSGSPLNSGAACSGPPPERQPEALPQVEAPYDRAVRKALHKVPGSRLVSVSITDTSTPEPLWRTRVSDQDGTVHIVRVDAVDGGLVDASVRPGSPRQRSIRPPLSPHQRSFCPRRRSSLSSNPSSAR